MAASSSHFGPKLFKFLRDLAANNNKTWFQENKPRYEDDVKEPLLNFISDFADHLEKISEQFNADPRPNGGSMFRIYRDARFAKDKDPYKTHAAAHFRHRVGKDVHAPGFYLHLEPRNCFMGGGIWHPDPPALRKIRDAIVAKPDDWKKVLKSGLVIEGDALTRAPQGYRADHPFVDDLKRKDFFTSIAFSDKEACSADFIKRYAQACKQSAPLIKFLTHAVELPF
jgi:uncharacterized protein (TIGR02453 family)